MTIRNVAVFLCFLSLTLFFISYIVHWTTAQSSQSTTTGTTGMPALIKKHPGKRIVCYYTAWTVYFKTDYKIDPQDFDPTLCTHMIYHLVVFDIYGRLRVDNQYIDIEWGGFKKLVALKKDNPDLKVMVSINERTRHDFFRIAANSTKRATMIKSARFFMETYGYDGIDIYWPAPTAKEKIYYIRLLEDFKNDFKKNGWLVSVLVKSNPLVGHDVKQMSNLLDFINIFTDNMYGPSSYHTGQNSPLYASSAENDFEKKNLNMDSRMNNWKNAGIDPNKINGEIAFYGNSFNLKNVNDRRIHADINGPGRGGPQGNEIGTWSYFEFCESRSSWNCTWDEEQKMPICTQGNLWLGIDNEDSVYHKVAYINENGFGGVAVWSIDQDDVHGICGAKNPLLSLINKSL